MRNELSLETIVVGYDGTRPAERALARAAALARVFGARVVVADVAAPQLAPETPGAFGVGPYYYGYSADLGLEADETLWRQHREHIDAFLDGRGVEHEFASIVGQPAAEIVEVAERAQAELIVVGTREPGFLERLFGGSVSEGVARRARCDVLVVHPEGESTTDE